MFGRKARRERPEKNRADDRSFDRSLDRGGYPGLEGDFESERRRAASTGDVSGAPYEHGEGDGPVLPSSTPGLTHP